MAHNFFFRLAPVGHAVSRWSASHIHGLLFIHPSGFFVSTGWFGESSKTFHGLEPILLDVYRQLYTWCSCHERQWGTSLTMNDKFCINTRVNMIQQKCSRAVLCWTCRDPKNFKTLNFKKLCGVCKFQSPLEALWISRFWDHFKVKFYNHLFGDYLDEKGHQRNAFFRSSFLNFFSGVCNVMALLQVIPRKLHLSMFMKNLNKVTVSGFYEYINIWDMSKCSTNVKYNCTRSHYDFFG